jgi:two-component system chemotaxis response regulator CheY
MRIDKLLFMLAGRKTDDKRHVDSRIHNGKALVVDDSKTIRLILSQTLGELGWNVEQAPNGQVALTWLDSQPEPAGLVLIDWNMPEMNGLDLVRQIRERTRMASSKLMMVTTETETEQIENAIKAGANEYVMKPFTKDIIVDKLRLMGLMQ